MNTMNTSKEASKVSKNKSLHLQLALEGIAGFVCLIVGTVIFSGLFFHLFSVGETEVLGGLVALIIGAAMWGDYVFRTAF